LLKDFVHHKNILSGLLEESLVAFKSGSLVDARLHHLMEETRLWLQSRVTGTAMSQLI